MLRINSRDVEKALQSYLGGKRLPGAGNAKTWFIESHDGQLLPLKHVMAIAAGVATKDFNTSDAISAAKKFKFRPIFIGTDLLSDLAAIRPNASSNATTIEQLILARLGQGKFRKALLKERPSCYITGYSDDRLLVASHIKPWARSSNEERLDPKNGLLLIPQLDRAFDKGMISFSKNGRILISTSLSSSKTLGIFSQMKLSNIAGREAYLEFHRDEVFN